MTTFQDFNLTKETLQGLNEADFITPTPIQRETLTFSLIGRDIQAQAKTGSGKTLAFLLPILDKLHSQKWTRDDGLGALIISPTRELALQIFKVLKQVGKKHTFSAGLLIGGKDFKQEQERVAFMNILVCTPGRLLQHMDTTVGFDCSNLKILVLDEADRLLDMGFKKTLDAIILNLGKERQTMLFSATLTTGVADLARLSLQNPEIVAVENCLNDCTPANLQQRYLICPLPSKLDILFSFIKSHLKQKIIVFISSCKQVRFVFESFCKLQPGIPLMCLHGKQNQQKRIGIFEQFSKKTQACLFATDVAARGLDIPSVDWVIQVDCPDDIDTYIHRVGRTARYNSKGQGLLFLCPSEAEFVKELEKKNISIAEIKINPSKQTCIKGSLASICSQSPDMKYLAQKAFICYMRSIYFQKNKNVFDVQKLPAEEFAESLGLVGAPNIKFMSQGSSKNKSRQMQHLDNKPVKLAPSLKNRLKEKCESDEEFAELPVMQKPKTKIDKLFAQKNLTVLSDHYTKLIKQESEGSDDEEFLMLARKDHDVSDTEEVRIPNKKTSKLKKRTMELGIGKKTVFDDEGQGTDAYKLKDLNDIGDITEETKEYYAKGVEKMKEIDVIDKERERKRRREERRERKLKEKKLRREDSGDPIQVSIGAADDEVIVGSDYDPDKNYDDLDSEPFASGYEMDHNSHDVQQGDRKISSNRRNYLQHLDQKSLEEMALNLLK